MNLELELLTKKVVFFQIEKPSEKEPLFVDYDPNVHIDMVLGNIHVPQTVTDQMKRTPTGKAIVWQNEQSTHLLEFLYFNWEQVEILDSFFKVLSAKIEYVFKEQELESAPKVLWVFIPQIVSTAVVTFFFPNNKGNMVLYRSSSTLPAHVLVCQKSLGANGKTEYSFVSYKGKTIAEV